jgi:predicted GTPase/uncharacterized protein (DUF697 family)
MQDDTSGSHGTPDEQAVSTAAAGDELTPERIEAAYAAAREEEVRNRRPVTVLVAGNTGAGKSTLINTVFGREVARTGTGRPVTEDVEEYVSEVPPLRLLDTRGFEAGDGIAFDKVDAELAKRREQGDPAAHIHVAWLCVLSGSNRFEPVNEKFVQRVAERSIPCVIVLTQADRETDLLDHVNQFLTEHRRRFPKHDIDVVELLAQPTKGRNGQETRAYGVAELLNLTDRFLDAGMRTAFAQAQIVNIDLKKREARTIVTIAAAAAGGSAAIPVPGGHGVALALIQVGMMAKIDLIFGRSLLGGKTAIQGAATKIAAMGGRWAFGLALETALKFIPGAGSIAGTAIGGTVGTAITTTMGLAYIEISARVASGDPTLSNAAAILDALLAEVMKMKRAA